MKVLITGTSQGIGKAIADKFIAEGHEVFGIDIKESTIQSNRYTHYICNICDSNLPDIEGVNILINNAGVQSTGNEIDVNLKGTINVTNKYGLQPYIRSILMVSSASAITGSEFPEYCASKGGVSTYGKNIAIKIAKEYGATCNNLCPGGVKTELNQHIFNTDYLYEQCLAETMLHRWAEPEEIADWAYFLTVTNQFMTAQDVLVDGGEANKCNFIW